MRGNIIGRRISNPISNSAFLLSSFPFSTSSGGGRGRGGGSGFSYDPGKVDFVNQLPGKPESDKPKPISPQPQPGGIGRGNGNFSSFISSLKTSKPAIERGPAPDEPGRSRPPDSQVQSVPPRRQFVHPGEQNLPSSLHSGLSGVGRGKSAASPPPKLTEENRHIRSRPKPKPDGGAAPARPKISREEAVKRAVSILSKAEGEGYGRGVGSGRGRGRGVGRGRGSGEQIGSFNDYDDSYGELYLGNEADAEKFAERIGVENMQKLEEGFEELSSRVLPDPEEDAYVDAMHTNYAIEFEPEYLMGDFDQNPDINEKPPMSIRDMLEKVKPFIMAYEGIQSQEEWEEVVEETMKRVPLLKEIVDYYSGPDRVTAKKQQEELARVAKTIPVSAPASVKQFTDRAVLSLQSNPGWGFDKKCQFMDKLGREVSQCYN